MKKIIFVIVGLALLLTTKVYAYDNGDFQIWHTENQEFKMNKELKITLEEEFRWGNNAIDFYYNHYDAGFVYNLNKYLGLGISYRQVYEKKKGKFKEENRPYVNATLKYEFYGFSLNDRNRIEYRHFDYQADTWRYRNKLALKFPWKVTKFEIQPYVADEIFVELNSSSLSRNRMYSGFGFSLTESVKGEAYYLLQSTKSSGKWVNANVLGTKLKIVF